MIILYETIHRMQRHDVFREITTIMYSTRAKSVGELHPRPERDPEDGYTGYSKGAHLTEPATPRV